MSASRRRAGMGRRVCRGWRAVGMGVCVLRDSAGLVVIVTLTSVCRLPVVLAALAAMDWGHLFVTAPLVLLGSYARPTLTIVRRAHATIWRLALTL